MARKNFTYWQKQFDRGMVRMSGIPGKYRWRVRANCWKVHTASFRPIEERLRKGINPSRAKKRAANRAAFRKQSRMKPMRWKQKRLTYYDMPRDPVTGVIGTGPRRPKRRLKVKYASQMPWRPGLEHLRELNRELGINPRRRGGRSRRNPGSFTEDDFDPKDRRKKWAGGWEVFAHADDYNARDGSVRNAKPYRASGSNGFSEADIFKHSEIIERHADRQGASRFLEHIKIGKARGVWRFELEFGS